MKKCSQCGRLYSDLISTCSYCGTPLGGSAPAGSGKPATPPVRSSTPPVQPATPPVQPATPPVRTSTPPVKPAPAAAPAVENVGKGFLGACLFALGGAVVQAILINIGIVAAAAGFITCLLAIYGYQKYSGNAASTKAVWIGIPVSLLMIVLGTAFGYSFYCAQQWGVRLSEAAHLIQQNSAIADAMGEDIMKSLMLWGVAVVFSLIRRKKK